MSDFFEDCLQNGAGANSTEILPSIHVDGDARNEVSDESGLVTTDCQLDSAFPDDIDGKLTNGEDSGFDQCNGHCVEETGDVMNEEHCDGEVSEEVTSKSLQEPENMIRWREERKKKIEEQDEKELKELSEWKEKARKELENWEQKRIDWIEKIREENRAIEESLNERKKENNRIGYVPEFAKSDGDNAEDGPGQDWLNITRLCDFNKKSKSSQDISRMRSTLVQLRETKWINPVTLK